MNSDSIQTPIEGISLEDLAFHPKVLAELQIEQAKWSDALKKISPDRLLAVQGKVEILEWILTRMMNEIAQKEREKVKAAEATQAER